MEKKFYLSSTDKIIGGVCGGIAEYLGVKPIFVRIAIILLTLFLSYLGILVIGGYIGMWLLCSRKSVMKSEQTKQARKIINNIVSDTKEKNILILPTDIKIMEDRYYKEKDFYNFEEVNFSQCKQLKEIRGWAFYECEKLKEVDFSQCTQLEEIGERAFYKCKSLERVVLPVSLKTLNEDAFLECDNLKEIDFSQCKQLEEIEEETFRELKKLERVVLPASLKFIMEAGFYQCENLKEVDFTQCTQLEEIGEWAFGKCKILERVVLPASLKSIKKSAFNQCENLKEVDFSQCKQLEEIGEYAFYKCVKLERVVLSASLKSIKKWAFSKCENLKEVDFSQCKQLEEIGKWAFSECRLINIFIPDSVKTIDSGAFLKNGIIESVTIGKSAKGYGNSSNSNDRSNDILGGASINNLTIKAEAAEYTGAKTVTKVVLCDTVKELKKWAFAKCEQLEEIVIPDSVTKIGYGAFEKASSLSSVVIPDSVTEIEAIAFDKTNLKTIVFPKELEKLESFGDMEYLRRLDFSKVTKLKVIPQEFLYGVPKLRELTMPMGVVTIKDHLGGENLNTLYLPPTVEEVGEVGYNKSIYCFSPKLETLTAIADGAQDAKDSEDVKDGEFANRLHVLPEYLDDYKRLQKEERISEDLLKIDIIPDDELHHYKE